MTETSRIHCGIAGWSYSDWEGYVYPSGVRDKLAFIAPFVDAIEINSTFYRPPSGQNAASWARRTAELDDFFFTAKLHGDVTHKGRVDRAMVKAFNDGLKPLTEAGKLRHLLAQFRYDFADSAGARKHLQNIRSSFGDITNLTFELRHNSWQSPGAIEYLESLKSTVANLDYPLARNSFSLRECLVGEHAYLRVHGRNRKAWFDAKSGRDETYNYLYSPEEIKNIARRALSLAQRSRSLTVIANNHYRGKEAVNALEIKSAVTGEKVKVPPELLDKYPRLRDISAE
ncbi:MAG: DUF72 domain-containing protein [Kiritimatiellia bacterium]